MKQSISWTWLRSLGLVILAGCVAYGPLAAQGVAQYDAATTQKYDKNANGILEPDEIAAMTAAQSGSVVTMSPFEVSTERDRGFQSSSVGSGSRLKVDLAETPVAYSVINREFMDALGIVDMADAISWSTGSTYYYSDNGNTSFGRASSVQVRGNQVYIGAGTDSFGGQRNFYQNSSSSMDSFSVETYDFGRGPNAALFGNGNGANGGLGGVQSSQTKQARFDRTNAQVSMTFDQFGSKRVSADFNRPISDRIGVRINAVYSDTHHKRVVERQQTKGLALNLKFKISPTTDLAIDGNHEWHTTHGIGGGMDEYVSGWDGATVTRGPITNAMLSTTVAIAPAISTTQASWITGGAQISGINPVTGSVGLNFNGEPQGVTRLGDNFYVFDPYTNKVMDYFNYPVTRRNDTTTRVPLWSRTAPNRSYYVRDPALKDGLPLQGNGQLQPGFGAGRTPQYIEFGGQGGIPTDLFYKAIENSKYRTPPEHYSDSLDHPSNLQFSKDLQFALTQRIGSKIFIDIGGDVNRNHDITSDYDNPNSAGDGGRSFTLDVNMLKPDGTPNEHFLSPWTSLLISERHNYVGDQALRVNFVYTPLDLGRWGNYTFNINGNISQNQAITNVYRLSVKQNADRRLWGADALRIRVNWTDVHNTYTLPRSAELTEITSTTAGVMSMAKSSVTPEWVLYTGGGFGGGGAIGSESFRKTKYALFQVSARYWNNRVIATGAFRRDIQTGSTKTSLALGDYPANWDNNTVLYRPAAPADYFSLTYVQRNPTTGAVTTGNTIPAATRPRTTIAGLSVRNPVFANDRFRDDFSNPDANNAGSTKSFGLVVKATKTISPYLNYSDTYTPNSNTNLDMLGDIRPPITAKGYDMGANLSFLNGNVTLKFNYFKNVREGDSVAAPTATHINSLFQANRVDDPDTTASGRNVRGVNDLPGNDYQNVRNDGREVEVAATPLPGWRMTLNGSWTFTTQSARFPLSKGYVPANSDLFRLILEDAGGVLDTSRKPSPAIEGYSAPSAPGVARSGATTGIDTTNAVNAYNNIWRFYDNSVLDPRIARTPQQPTMNIFNDYTIQSGALKGLRFGAGIQWQGEFASGSYGTQTILDPKNSIPTAIDDPTWDEFDRFWGHPTYQTTATIGYRFTNVFGNPLQLQLIVKNFTGYKRIVYGDIQFGGPGLRQPEGNLLLPNRSPSRHLVSRFMDPTNWSFTATYSFGASASR